MSSMGHAPSQAPSSGTSIVIGKSSVKVDFPLNLVIQIAQLGRRSIGLERARHSSGCSMMFDNDDGMARIYSYLIDPTFNVHLWPTLEAHGERIELKNSCFDRVAKELVA